MASSPDSRSPASLDTILPEMILQIMINLDSAYAVMSLILTSKMFRNIYETYKKTIQGAVTERSFDATVIPEALLLADRLGPLAQNGEDKRSILQELQLARVPNSCVFRPWTLDTYQRLFLVSYHVDMFVKDFSERKLDRFRQYAAATFQVKSQKGSPTLPQPELKFFNSSLTPLTKVEKIRIQRAFLRFEIFSVMFMERRVQVHGQDLARDLAAFCANFSAWEIEEIACVRDYLTKTVLEIIREVDDALVPALQANTSIPINNTSIKHHEAMEHIILSGLSQLRRLISGDNASKVSRLVSLNGHIWVLGWMLQLRRVLRHVSRVGRPGSVHISLPGGIIDTAGRRRFATEGVAMRPGLRRVEVLLSPYMPMPRGYNVPTTRNILIKSTEKRFDNHESGSMGWNWYAELKAEKEQDENSPALPEMRDWACIFWDEVRLWGSQIFPSHARHRLSEWNVQCKPLEESCPGLSRLMGEMPDTQATTRTPVPAVENSEAETPDRGEEMLLELTLCQ